MNAERSDQSNLDQQHRSFCGDLIPRFVEGPHGPQISSVEDMNRLVDFINCLKRARIQRGPGDAIIITDSEFIIQIAADQGALSAVTAG